MKLKIGLVLITLSFTAIAFQNCSKMNFSAADTGAYFKAEAPADFSQVPPEPSQIGGGNDGSTLAPLPDVSKNPEMPDQSDQDKDKDKDSDKDKDPNKCIDKDQDENRENGQASQISMVECQLISPNMKIKLGQDFAGEHSNGQSSRVCMSENACLKILNAYAANHSCSMASGVVTSPGNPAQCTEIFPGSKGTCHNAKIISDAEIVKILDAMGK
jgi:hypothetical protein